jgi:hypothetical protein
VWVIGRAHELNKSGEMILELNRSSSRALNEMGEL